MTGQGLLDTMELLDQELQLQPGEANVTRGLLALNIAQDTFEAAMARRANCWPSGDGTFVQTLNQEYSLMPTGLLRLDGLQYIDPQTSLPAWDIDDAKKVGSQVRGFTWFQQLISSVTATGKPRYYWTNGNKIYWNPLPDAANTIRYYGLVAAADITASGPFAYPDIVRLPLATFAVSLLKMGVDDDPTTISTLSASLFDSTVNLLANANHSSAEPLTYSKDHR